jgi:UPF0176 protein
MSLHNKIDKRILKERLQNEPFKRFTISFYRYVYIDSPQEFRDNLYREWEGLNCFGRIYIAHEGINAQMSIPEHHREAFFEKLEKHDYLKHMPIKYAVEDDGKSFYKLIIKVRDKVLADGVEDHTYDVTNVGNHLSALDFHNALDSEDTVVVDVRNHYESEIGYFENALKPDADTFREEMQMLPEMLNDKKDKKVLLYCTGGIRCEKASAYLKHHGFEDVNQLHGGVIEYARQIKQMGLESKFKGKNFVFDERLGESIDGCVVSHCHQCGNPADTHTNCNNDDCHLLFIQCDLCKEKYNGCCTTDCQEIIELPKEMRIQFREKNKEKYAESKIFKSRLRPKLKHLNKVSEEVKMDGE